MEINKQHLDAAITRLPQYQPPEDLWDDIAAQLDFDQNLDVALHELPTYAPPPAIWDELAARIEPVPRRFTVLRWLGLALALLLLTGVLVYQLFTPDPAPVQPKNIPVAEAPLQPDVDEGADLASTQPVAARASDNAGARPNAGARFHRVPKAQQTWTHRTEVADDVVLKASQNADDPGYALIETLCREALPLCEEPQFKQLKTELDELSRAHTELKNALGDFADDPELVTQLVRIEQSRNQILQQLIILM